MDIGGGVGGGLPQAHHLLRGLGGHVQIQHAGRLRQPQQVVLKVEQPVQKRVPLLRRQLAGLVDGVAGGVAVGDQQAALLVIRAPVLLVGGVAIHGVEHRRGIGVDIAGLVAEGAAQIQADQRRGFLLVAREFQLAKGNTAARQLVAQQAGLGGLTGAVRPLEHDKFSLHTVASRGHTAP